MGGRHIFFRFFGIPEGEEVLLYDGFSSTKSRNRFFNLDSCDLGFVIYFYTKKVNRP